MGGGFGNFGAGDKGKLTLGCPLARRALASSSAPMISASIMSSRVSTKCPELDFLFSGFRCPISGHLKISVNTRLSSALELYVHWWA